MSAVGRAAVDIEEFEAVVRLHWSRVFRFVLASVRDPDAAGSLTQDCFFRAWRARERFRGECSVQAWLLRIAVNLARDHARNRRLQFWKRARVPVADLDFAVAGATPEERALAGERLRAVWEAMEKLPGRQRTVFLLRFVEDMDLLEIASATGMKEGTVKAHLFRALHAVRERVRRTE